MTIESDGVNDFLPAKKHIAVSVGQSVRIVRELQGMSRMELASRTLIPEPTLALIERDRIALDIEHAKTIARALKCHPAVLVFPGWGEAGEGVA